MPRTHQNQSLPVPAADEVHVWSAAVTAGLPGLARHAALLSAEEKLRAGRFVREEDRSRYVVAHGILRQLLGRYLSADPAELRFVANAFGKPALWPEAGKPLLQFNLSHSGDLILYAVTAGRRVGVDGERIRTDVNVLELARSQFSPQEIRALQALPGTGQGAAFFRGWTRKEACVKALGEGLSFPLKEFSVSLGPDEPPAVQWAEGTGPASAVWSMFDLSAAPDYAGAVVCEGRVRLVRRAWVDGQVPTTLA